MSTLYRVRYWRVGDCAVQDVLRHALDEPTLRAEIQASGNTVLSIRTASVPWSLRLRSLLTLRTTPQLAFSLFCREVRTLLQAGMTIVEAVETLCARERLEGRSDTLAALLLVHLQQGLSLSSALHAIAATPVVLIAAVRAGERTSNLLEALDDYLRFDKLVTELRKKIVSAAIYPTLVSAVGLAVSLFLLLGVMPKFSSMYENLRGTAHGSTLLTMQISQFLGENRGAVFAVLLFIGVSVALWIASGKAKIHALWLASHTTWIRRRAEDFQLAMMYQALALLLKGGYPMTQAMQVAAQSALSPRLCTAMGAALRTVEQGGLVSQALSQVQLCDEVGRRLMAAAERNGAFYRAADVVSRMHAERFELFVERFTRMVEPLLLLGVALVVGGIVVLMYLPVFDMTTQLR